MIEVTAKLVKGPVYLAGDTVECLIIFKNPASEPQMKAQSNRDVEVLAWASVQIHCLCTINEVKVKCPESGNGIAEEAAISNTATSFVPSRGENGHVVLSTAPKILFCDLELATGESKTFMYSEALPGEGPPSHRGQAVKYSYKITVGTQRVGRQIHLLRVPVRVLVLPGLIDASACGDSEEVTPSNPFLETQQRETPLDVALQMLQNITARRTPNFYNITNSKGKVARFCLFKQAYKLGEDIVGTFDFSGASVPCVQFSVTLQSEEEVSEGSRIRSQQLPSVVSYNKYHEVCIGLQHSQLILPIPLSLTPAFTTNLVTLRWRLHFEFVTSLAPLERPPAAESDGGTYWQGPSSLDIETMVWNLPFRIYPTAPSHISQGLHSQVTCTTTL